MDERTGLGKMVYPDGAEYGGLWRNGVLVEVLDSLDFSEVTTTASPTTMSDVTETDVTTATTSCSGQLQFGIRYLSHILNSTILVIVQIIFCHIYLSSISRYIFQ